MKQIDPPLYKAILKRIRLVTNTKTQRQLGNELGFRQSTIAESERRRAIPSEWFIRLFEKRGVNPDWLKTGCGPVYLRTESGYGPSVDSADLENPQPTDPRHTCRLVTVYGQHCHAAGSSDTPELEAVSKVMLPALYLTPTILPFRLDTETAADFGGTSGYAGADTAENRPRNGDLFALFLPPDRIILRRVIFSGDYADFLLYPNKAAEPDFCIPASECLPRLIGRICWTFLSWA